MQARAATEHISDPALDRLAQQAAAAPPAQNRDSAKGTDTSPRVESDRPEEPRPAARLEVPSGGLVFITDPNQAQVRWPGLPAGASREEVRAQAKRMVGELHGDRSQELRRSLDGAGLWTTVMSPEVLLEIGVSPATVEDRAVQLEGRLAEAQLRSEFACEVDSSDGRVSIRVEYTWPLCTLPIFAPIALVPIMCAIYGQVDPRAVVEAKSTFEDLEEKKEYRRQHSSNVLSMCLSDEEVLPVHLSRRMYVCVTGEEVAPAISQSWNGPKQADRLARAIVAMRYLDAAPFVRKLASLAIALNKLRTLDLPPEVYILGANSLTDKIMRTMFEFRRRDQPIPGVPGEFYLSIPSVEEHFLNFLLEALQSGSASVVRSKVVVVGRVAQGKSSFVRSLVSGQPSPTDAADPQPATRKLDLHEWTGADDVQSFIFDFAGHHKYANTHSLFITERSVFVHCVNIADPALFREWETLIPDRVLFGLRAVRAHAPGADPIIVATHADQVLSAEAACEWLRAKLEEADALQRRELEAERGRLENLLRADGAGAGADAGATDQAEDVDSELFDRLAEVRHLLRSWPALPTRILPFSTVTLQGLDQVRDAMLQDSRAQSIQLPITYVQLFDHVRGLARALGEGATGMVTLDQLIDEAETLLGLSSESARTCLTLMHRMGEILWYEDVVELRDVVFVSPAHFVGKLRELLRHDMGETLGCALRYPLPPAFASSADQDRALDELSDAGVLHLGLLASVNRETGAPLFPYWQAALMDERGALLRAAGHFRLVRRVDDQRIMVPSYLPEREETGLADDIPHPAAPSRAARMLEFTFHLPDPLFLELHVALHLRPGAVTRRSSLVHTCVNFPGLGVELSVKQARDPLTGRGFVFAEAAGHSLDACTKVVEWTVHDCLAILRRFRGAQFAVLKVELGTPHPRGRRPRMLDDPLVASVVHAGRVRGVRRLERHEPPDAHASEVGLLRQVFVSYAWGHAESREWVQREFVPKLRERLVDLGVSVELDVEPESVDAQMSDSKNQWMVEMASRSRLVVVVGSPVYVDKVEGGRHGGVVLEWRHIFDRQTRHDKRTAVVLPPGVGFEVGVPEQLRTDMVYAVGAGGEGFEAFVEGVMRVF